MVRAPAPAKVGPPEGPDDSGGLTGSRSPLLLDAGTWLRGALTGPRSFFARGA